ncbi:MAG: branched-chain amino acid ABC transporter substrate-binding protein [Deltaproteobacteria bacterium]|jgi:branched-chain amino acid transport system substrate-binding protein|nr:branched-chain amino acid ABC transporter substrate-binding protein [Deltaproteobacteria bacterium]
MPKILIILLLTLICASHALAQNQDQGEEQEPEPLRIGFGGALLGRLAAYGLSNLYGIEYAINKVNIAGGVLGRRVILVQQDDSCESALASAAATKLTTEGIKLVLGHTCSGPTNSALSVYGNNAIVISSSATETSLTKSGNHPFFFRTTPRDDAQSSLQYKLIRANGYKKIAILHDKGEYGKALAELLEAAIKADSSSGITLVLVEGLTAGQVSFDAIVSKVKASDADALVWGGYYNDASKLAISLREKGLDIPIIGADGIYNLRYIELGGKAVENSYATGQIDISHSPTALAAIADHKTRHTEDIGTYFFYAAGAAQALFAAIEHAGSATDLPLIKKHLHEDTVDTVMGPIRFDTSGDIIGANFNLYVVKNGQFVLNILNNSVN